MDFYIWGEWFSSIDGICRHDNDFFLSGGSGVDFFSPADGWLVCISNNGDSLWSKAYGGEDDDGFTSISATGDAGYILAGFTHSYGQGDSDFYLVKIDPLGDTIWTRTYGSPGFDVCYALQPTSDGGYIMGGMCDNGAYIVKTEAQGEVIWDDRDDGFTYTMYMEVKQTGDGGYIAVGIAHADGGEQLYLVKFDSDGNREWDRRYGQTPNCYTNGEDVHQTLDGGYLIVGHIYEPYDPLASYILRTDPVGDTVWSMTFRIPGAHNWLNALAPLDSNEYVTTGVYNGDFWLMKFYEPLYCCDVDMIPDDDPIIVQPGGSFGYIGTLINPTEFSLAFDVWVGVVYEDQFFETRKFDRTEPLEPGEFLTRHFRQNVPNYAPVGDYRYVAYGGNYPSKCDSVWFDFTVTGDGRLAGIDGEVIARSPKGDEAIHILRSRSLALRDHRTMCCRVAAPDIVSKPSLPRSHRDAANAKRSNPSPRSCPADIPV